MGIVILGIESSCDETAAAVVEDGARLRASVVASQIATHRPYGGIVPELASREHLRAIVPVVSQALADAGLWLRDANAIAVTQGPGLVGSLLVGLTYAKALAFSLGLPLVAVNHLEGHIHAVMLEQRLRGLEEIELPALALVVSGGHTITFLVSQEGGGFQYRILGRTRDDAAGEAFDKVAKLLGLGFPGGPVIDRLGRFGDPRSVPFTPPKVKSNPLDFSFSGIKTAVLRYVQANPMQEEIARRQAMLQRHPTADELRQACSQTTLNLIASFQRAVVEDLAERTLAAARQRDVRSLIISGGVACNSLLRERFGSLPAREALPVYFPSPALSTDNAAMIAAAAYPRYMAGEFAGFDAAPQSTLALTESRP